MKLTKETKALVKSALKEDIGKGDITTNAIADEEAQAHATITAKESGIICGIDIAKECFMQLDKNAEFRAFVKDGSKVQKGTEIAEVVGNARALLAAERTALNFLQHLSGISTLTNQFVESVKEYDARILDTRKTLPGLRQLEKYSTKIGGAENHRMGLYDMVLIKDNHIKLAGSIKKAISKARKKNRKKSIEVEVKTLEQFKEALNEKPNTIMLDNMSFDEMEAAVHIRDKLGKKVLIEASGGVELDTAAEVAKCGVDFISVGKLTHSAKALDISMKVVFVS